MTKKWGLFSRKRSCVIKFNAYAIDVSNQIFILTGISEYAIEIHRNYDN